MERSWPTPPSDNNQSLYLWALEIVKLLRTGEVLTVGAIPTTREVLSAVRTYYVRTDGSDSNDGLTNSAGGAFLTLNKARDIILTLDLSGFDVTIKMGNTGTFTGGLSWTKAPLGGNVILEGDTGTPANTIISTTSANAVEVKARMQLTVQFCELRTTTSGNALHAEGGGSRINVGSSVRFGATARAQIRAISGGYCFNLSNNYTISGGAQQHYSAALNGIIELQTSTVTLSGTPAFSSSFAAASICSCISAFSMTFSGAATGTRFIADMDSAIQTYGGGLTYFPGSLAGSVASGGIYDGLVDYVTDAQVRAATAGRFVLTADKLSSAAAFVALTDAATIAVDWNTFINGSVTVTANRIIGNPTNGQPGTYRGIVVAGNDATLRTITFGAQFLGDLPVITDATSTKLYLITIYCFTSTSFSASAKRIVG